MEKGSLFVTIKLLASKMSKVLQTGIVPSERMN